MPLDGTTHKTEADVNTMELLKLADFIERCPLKFRMQLGYAEPECGMAGCVLGHAALMWKKGEGNYYYIDRKEFSERLGLSKVQARLLCFTPPGVSYNQINNDPSIAVRAVRHLALTGEVSFTNA